MPAFRLLLLLLFLLPGLARADAIHLEMIGGRIETHVNGDVVLTLEIAPDRLDLMARAPEGSLRTWGDVRRHDDTLQQVFLRALTLNAGGRAVPPSVVEIPSLASQPATAPLPNFVPLQVTWRHVGLINAAFAANQVTANFHFGDMVIVQLMLEDDMPWWRVLFRSMLIGFQHIVPSGLDHILFVLGIYLATRRFSDLLWQVTAFTVAHSITLGLTMSGVIIVGPFYEQFVEIGIAVSIFVVAFENCLWRKPPGWPRILIVGGFGLIHGMGFAGRLAEVKWPPGTFFLSLFGANVGIELGQLAVIAVAALLTVWWIHCPWYQERIAVPISLLIGLYGMFAALDRISALTFPQKQFLDSWWNFYDNHFWAVPVLIGFGVLLMLWILYRAARNVRTRLWV